MKNVLVVTNFNAGRKSAIKYKKFVLNFLLKHCEKLKFITIDEFNDFAIQDFDSIIAIGGDGTVSKVSQKIVNTDKVLGIVPTGTANLLASKLGISSNFKKALLKIVEGKISKIDVVKINNYYSILRFGLGYDSDIICKISQSLKNKFGYFAYFIAGILFAFRLKPKFAELVTNDGIKTYNQTCLIISNTANMYRNLVSVSKSSSLDDGLMDVFIMEAKNSVSFFFEFLKVVLGIEDKNSFKTNKLTLKNSIITTHIDGEKFKLQGDVEFEVLPSAIKVYS